MESILNALVGTGCAKVALNVNVIHDLGKAIVCADFGLGMQPVFEYCGCSCINKQHLVGMSKADMLAYKSQNLA